METIKKFLNPGKEHEDEVLYGSGQDPLLTGTQSAQTPGQDSQLGGKATTANDPRSSATDPAVSSDYANTEGRDLGTGGPSSSLGKGDQSFSPAPRGVADETSTTASILSGVPGKDQSSSLTGPAGTNDTLDVNKPLPREPTGAGLANPDSSLAQPYTATHAEKVDPYASLGRDRSRDIGTENTAGSGLTGSTLPDRTVGSSEYNTQPQPADSLLGRDAALGAGVGAGVGAGTAAALHHKRDEDNLRSASGRSNPSAANADSLTTGTGLSGTTAGTSAGPHSSSLANKADPRVDSDLYGSGTAGPHSSNLANKADPRVDSDLDGSGTAGLHSSSLANKADPRVDSDLDGSRTAGPHSSGLANKADPRVDSDLDGSRTAGGVGYTSGTGLSGGAIPQSASGRDTQTGTGSGIGTVPASQTSAASHGPESWKHEHVSHGHTFAGDPCHDDNVDGRPLFTKGPHITDTANLLDPHVTPQVRLPSESTAISSDREAGLPAQSGDHHRREAPALGSTISGDSQQGREVPGLGSTAHTGSYQGGESAASQPVSQGDHHHGRDAALAGGLGAAGTAAAYSSTRDDAPPTEQTPTTTGPHHRSKLLNKLDPRVHSSPAGSEQPTSTAETSALIGSSDPGSASHMPTSKEVGSSHDHSRDAGIGAGAAGAAGLAGIAGHGHEKHSKNLESTATPASTAGFGSSDTAEATDKGAYGSGVTSAVDRGLGTSEKEPYFHEDKAGDRTSRLPDIPDGHYSKSQVPTDSRGKETTVPSATKDSVGTEPKSDSGHHFLRDAGLASAGVGGGLAAYEVQKVHTRDQPDISSSEPSTYPSSGQVGESQIAGTHTGHDSAPVSGGVGTGLGTDDGAEFSKREAEKLAEAREKEYEKEQKAIHKEEVKHEKALAKEEKQHEKEERKHEKALAKEEKAIAKEEKAIAKEEKALAKEEKQHEKEERKQEKALEKEEKRLQKEEKKHEKELAKEEKEHQDDGKKHGGILGLFHRDKSDKADETEVRDEYPERSYQETEPTGVPAVGDDTGVGTGTEGEKHKPNKLHKDPPAGYYESKGYNPSTTGDGSQPSGGNEYSSDFQRSTTGDVYPKVPGGTIIDPQTGLPVNLEQGSGAGGTDSGTMPGYHAREADASAPDRSRDINQL